MTTPQLRLLAHNLATICEQFGSPRVAALLRGTGFTGYERDDVLVATVVELRRRGRDGLASQTAAMRWDESEVA